MKTKYKRKPTPAMLRMMQSIKETGDGGSHLRGNSQHGGACGTITALVRHGYAIFAKSSREKDYLTQAGEDCLSNSLTS